MFPVSIILCNKIPPNFMSQSNGYFICSQFYNLGWTQLGDSSAGLISNHSCAYTWPAGWVSASLSWDIKMLGSPSLHVVSRALSVHIASQCALFRFRVANLLIWWLRTPKNTNAEIISPS